jgi:hypothetical protein
MRPIGRLSAISLKRLERTAGLHGDGGGLYLASDGKQQCSWTSGFRFDRRDALPYAPSRFNGALGIRDRAQPARSALFRER